MYFATVSNIAAGLAKLNIDAPPAMASALTDVRKVGESAPTSGATTTERLADAAAAAILAGKDPVADKTVLATVTARAAADLPWPSILNEWVERRCRAILFEHGPALFALLGDAVARGGADLAEATPHLSASLDLPSQGAGIANAPERIIHAWKVASAAVETIKSAVALQLMVATKTNAINHSRDETLILAAPNVTADDLNGLPRGNYWALAAGRGRLITGCTSPEQYAAALARLLREFADNDTRANAEVQRLTANAWMH